MEDLYPEIDTPRLEDRAKVWTLNRGQLTAVSDNGFDLGRLGGRKLLSDFDERDRIWNRVEKALHLAYPIDQEDYPKRGDLVYLEPELDREENTNVGKYLYDGTRLQELIIDDHTGYTFLPNEMEVVWEFPILYWEGRLANPYVVNFELFRHFPRISIREISHHGAYAYFPFNAGEDQYQILFKGSRERMLEQINANYFGTTAVLGEDADDFDPNLTLVLNY